jgi:hypothetical protein
VPPDACVDIVFINDEPPMVFGPWTVPFVARLAAGTSITGARLHPGRAPSLLGMPASELLNQAIPIAAVKGAVQNMRLGKVIEQPNPQLGDRLSPKFYLPQLNIPLQSTRPSWQVSSGSRAIRMAVSSN